MSREVLEDLSVKHLRLLWSDAAGLRRVRCVPLPSQGRLRALERLEREGVGITKALMALPAYADVPAPSSGLGPVGEVRLRPIFDTAVRLPWKMDTAMVFVNMHDNEVDGPWSCCPRACLTRVLNRAAARGFSFEIGFETEFVLLKTDRKPVDSSTYCSSRALDASSDVLAEMVEALAALNITVLQYHAESAPGQFEFSTLHSDPMNAADQLLLTREAITAVARRHRLSAVFLPKPFENAAGNSSHCHVSIWASSPTTPAEVGPLSRSGTSSDVEFANGAAAADPAAAAAAAAAAAPLACNGNGGGGSSSRVNVLERSVGVRSPAPASPALGPTRPALDPTAGSFLAGILWHLPAILSLTAPTPNSFRRIVPGAWAGAYSCWGVDNREAPVRVCTPPTARDGASHLEYKSFDATANPYVAIAAVLAAGLHGIERGLQVPLPVQMDPAALSAEERQAAGILRLPTDAISAIVALRTAESEPVRRWVGEDIVRAICAVHAAEAAHAEETQMDFAAEFALLFDRY